MKNKSINIFQMSAAMVLLFGCIFYPVMSKAQSTSFPIREMSNKLYGSSLSATLPNELIVANDQRSNMLASPSSFAATVKYKANYTIVKLAIDHAATTVPSAPYIYKMAYMIQGATSMSSSVYTFTAYDTLVIAYNPDSLTAYQDVQIKTYPQLFDAKVTITNFFDISTSTPVALTMPPPNTNFFVELSMQYQPYLKTHAVPADMALNTSHTYDAGTQSLNINWAPSTTPLFLGKVTPAQYELEWTYIDNYAANGGTLSTSALTYNFKNNATRIITDSLAYRIPVIYPKGYILYRVRMIRVDEATYKYPIYGVWSLPNVSGNLSTLSSSKYYQITAPHSGDSLNWNYTIHFAEGGKYKHVMGYFDGMLKNRQTITRFNSDPNRLLATENIYDYEGRAAITTLPTVINTNRFAYQPNVSISSATGLPYAPADFDLKPALCPDEVIIPPFADYSLANKYYSRLNTDTVGMQKFVPQAEGYPFVHTQLSTGFSDRVDASGGAGTVLQINKGHDTKYEYMQADQPDLNNLFGINAGNSSFYTKTVTKDPNGQNALMVKDYEGKQIMTSMFGAAVDTSTIAIMFNDEVPPAGNFRENKLSNPAVNYTVGSEKKYSGSFYMDYDALSNIKYEYAFKPFQVCPAPSFLGLSVKCKYEYDVHDNCGKEILYKQGVLGITGVLTNPVAVPFSEDTNISLKKGKYTINKTLTISDGDVVAAVDSFFNHSPSCLKTENDFIREEVEKTNYPCPTTNPCDLLKKKMMEELFTDAKYGKWKTGSYMVPVVGLSPTMDTNNSIYDIPQWLPGGVIPKHRFRDNCVRDALNALVITKKGRTYKNIGGDLIQVFDAGSGSLIKEVAYDTAVTLFKDEIYTGSDQYKIAEVLLPLHPEYCKLLACFEDTFAIRLKAIPNAAVATKYGFFGLDSLVSKDIQLRTKMLAAPFNKVHIDDSLRLLLGGLIKMDTMASQMAFCLTDDGAVFDDAKKFFRTDIMALNFPTPRVKDSYFDKLRTFYLSNREKYVDMAKTGAGNNCPPCDSARMKLIPEPLIPVKYTPDGSYSFGPDGFLSLFSDSSLTKIKKFLDATSKMPADTTGSAAFKDSASRVVYRGDSTLCSIAVDSIMARLVNCYAAGASSSRLKDTLLAMVKRKEVQNGVFFPAQIRYAITAAGLSVSDLCHPYLVSYDYFDDGAGAKGNCNSASFYQAATQFFNEPSINTPIKSASTGFSSSTPTWPTANSFAAKIAAAISGGSGSIMMGVQYHNIDSIYTFSFYKSGSDTVQISLRAPKNIRRSGAVIPFLSVASSDSIIFQNLYCFFDDPTAYADGHVGRYMFRATIDRSETISGVVVKNKGEFLGWNNGKITMNEDGSNPIAACIPCTQFKDKYKAFADTMTLYGGFAQDHPFYYRAMRNFMNFNLKKTFSENQYDKFIVSCAFADSMRIPLYGGYARINFPATVSGSTYSNFDDFKDALALSDDLSLAATIDYKIGTTETVIIDYATIPFKKTKTFNDILVAAGGVIKPTTASGVIGQLYVPDAATASDFIAGTAFSLSTTATSLKLRPSPYLPDWEDYKRYDILATTPTYQQVSAGSAIIDKNIYNLAERAFWLPYHYTTVNMDYFNSKKQALLQYTYSMQALSPGKVLDTLQDYIIQQNIAAFGSTQVTYNNPQNAYRFTDLYYTDNISRYPGYDTIVSVLNFAKAHLGANKIFIPTSTNKVSLFGGTGSGKNLILYRCSDGLYWYRYFGAGSKLFNLFIRVPEYVFQKQHPNYQLVKIIPATGDTSTNNFTVAITIPGSADTILAAGTTNFEVAWTLKLRDVLMGNEKNYATSKDPLPSGETGAEPNCEQKLLENDIYNGKVNYYNYITKYREDLLLAFREHVMSQVGEKLWIEYIDMRFGTTLYSYDRADNLIQTVPPEGVKKIDSATATIVDSLRENNLYLSAAIPKHLKATQYEYNTANKPWKETTPDAGTKIMFYDLKGNVLLSQSARQRKRNAAMDKLGTFFTYFLYDAQNRLTETGEVEWSSGCPYFDPMPLYFKQGPMYIKNAQPFPCACENNTDSTWEYCGPSTTDFYSDSLFNDEIRSKPRTQVVYTVYDSAFIKLGTKTNQSPQENLRGRIAANMYYLDCAPGLPQLNFDHATHYSYDASGNVKTLVQDFPQLAGMNQRYKRIDYEYDLLSGKVNNISYNHGYADQFFQRYAYDADNRLTKVETSHDGFIWKRDAEYTYYQHGPLARVSIGDQRVQGIDYAYTIQGWLKAINGDLNDSLADMGRDGSRSTITPRDAYATTLDYFVGDYKPIGYTPLSKLATSNKSIYNGNIARQSNDVAPFGGLTTAYTYDQMNRIRKAKYAATKLDTVLMFNNWYASAYKYDMDGNLRELMRKEGTGITMDSMQYEYANPGKNNKLSNIFDHASFSKAGVEDIKFLPSIGYPTIVYDDDGNVRADIHSSNLEQASWNIYGKATMLYAGHGHSGGPHLNKLFYGYDALGHRTYKRNEYGDTGINLYKSTFYVREASGNILAEYNARIEYDQGRYIKVFPKIRATYTGATLMRDWLGALGTMGYLTDHAFADYIIARVGSSTTLATGYFLANNPSLVTPFLGGGFGTLRSMCNYSNATAEYPIADALQMSFDQNGAATPLLDISNALFGVPDSNLRRAAVLQLAQQVPDLPTQLAQQNQITLSSAADSATLLTLMDNLALSNPAYYGGELYNFYQQDPTILYNWLKTISTDTNYINLPWYTQQGYTSLCRNALVQFGDQAARQKAQAKGTDVINEGLYGFATWWGLEGKSVLSTIAGGQIHLDEVAYYDDPITYLSSLGSYDLLDSALNQVAYIDVIALNQELIGGTATWVWDVPLLKQEVSLANHHIYGSSRLGVINYWPGQYRNAWDFKTGLADTTRLNVPTPWYSYTYNDVIDSNHTEPSGGGTPYMGGTYYGLTHSSIGQHLLGQKQYELTNHLGNVQATLSDKRYVKTTGGGTVRDYFNASIVAAYDYYPYGMLMPDRFVSDTATRCVTTTQTQMVPVKTSTSVLASATAINGGTISSSGAGTTIYGQTGGMQIDIPVTAGIPIDIAVNVSYIYGSFISLSLSENIGLGTYKPLANTNANYPGTVTLSATPSTTTMRLNINMMSSYITAPLGGLFTISSAGSEKITYTPQNVLVTLCNKGTDKYEFGFNTQMKSNEVAGIGNWNTAEFWEYNTRTGVRENKDPVFVPWESPYSVNHSNPIANSDPNGDYSKGAAFALSLLHGAHGITQDSKTGEWGYRYSLTDKPGALGVDYGTPQKKPDGNRAALGNNKTAKDGFIKIGSQQLNTTTGLTNARRQSKDEANPSHMTGLILTASFLESYHLQMFDMSFAGEGMDNQESFYLPFGNGTPKAVTKTNSRSFFSGAGTEKRAINEGFTTISQTRAGQNLMKMTEGMPYYGPMNGQPASQAWQWWARLSATYAKGIPKGSSVNVFLNNPSPSGIWLNVEKPILQQREVNIISR